MSDGKITWISGPVLKARTIGAYHVNEAIFVGTEKLLGEVIQIDHDEIVAQVYEDTSGLRPGAAITGSGNPLSIRLGPSILGNIFDGLLRPLEKEAGVYVQPGMRSAQPARFYFAPLLKTGDPVSSGTIVGGVTPAAGGKDGRRQSILVPPQINGTISAIVDAGEYDDHQDIYTVKSADGKQHVLSMGHWWSIREARPIAKRLPTWGPLLTGQRMLDCMFPLACGGRAAMPGGFGTGKTVLQETLAKWCDADIIVYVGCGERGNEMAGVLHDLPQLEDPRTGRPLMERTVIIANVSNMPVAAREASIYTAVTVAEYFRDQGLRVALMADSTSRWAEALREISGRLGEIPGEGGFPAYLSSRLADFYERAAHVKALCGKVGSLSIIGAVSPPSADFSEPVTIHTKRYVRVFWALDAGRAQARFFPAIHPLQSYSGDIDDLAPFWKEHDHPQWLAQRRRFLTLLEEQTRLERMARIVGKDALPPRQQHTLLCAELINEAFLRQSAFSEADRYCSPARQGLMMQLLDRFIDLSQRVIEEKVDVDKIYKMPVIRRLRRMNEDLGEDKLEQYEVLRTDLDSAFAALKKKDDSYVT